MAPQPSISKEYTGQACCRPLQSERINEMHFLCQECVRRVDALLGSSHKCNGCTLDTYSAFKFCTCCAVEKDWCQNCGKKADSGRTDSDADELKAARAVYLAEVKGVDAEFDAAIADIRVEIDAWLKVNRDSAAAYDAGIRPYQEAYQTAAQALQELQSTGDNADSPALVAARQGVEEALAALRAAMPVLQKQMWDPIMEERARIGEEKLKRHEDEGRLQHRKTMKAQRRFELVAERIAGHLGVDAAYKLQLEQLDKQFGA